MCHFTKDEDGGELIFIMEPDSLYHGEWDLRWRHIDKTYQLVYDFGYHTQAGIPVTAFQVEHWMKWNPFGEVIPLLRDMACEGF